MRSSFLAIATGLVALVAPSLGHAEPMDPALGRLVLDPACRDDVGHYVDSDLAGLEAGPGGHAWCVPDEAAFKKLINQYGFALAPPAMHSARTTGYGGFDVSIQAMYSKISNNESYWELGTQGPVDPSTNSGSTINSSPASFLQLYSIVLRKGFGFGLEITGNVGFMPKTSLISGGADVRLSLLEGFRTGILGYFPDVAVGGGVRSISGIPEFQLTVASLDAQISKPIPIQDSSIITPWIGYQRLWIFGDSGLIDLTPATDAQGYCGYAGSNVPGNPDPSKTTDDGDFYYDGEPVCTNPAPGARLDFNNNAVFRPVRLDRHRLLIGAAYRYEMVKVSGEFITDLVSPASAQITDADERDLKGEDSQWALVFELGVAF